MSELLAITYRVADSNAEATRMMVHAFLDNDGKTSEPDKLDAIVISILLHH